MMQKPDEPITELPEFKKGHDVDDLARRVQKLEDTVKLLKAELVRQNIVSYTPDP